MAERPTPWEPDPLAVVAFVRRAASSYHAAAVFLLEARRPTRIAQIPASAAVAGTPGDAVRSVLDDLSWDEVAEVRHAIVAILNNEARAEGGLAPETPTL